jgi:hypothetical protein
LAFVLSSACGAGDPGTGSTGAGPCSATLTGDVASGISRITSSACGNNAGGAGSTSAVEVVQNGNSAIRLIAGFGPGDVSSTAGVTFNRNAGTLPVDVVVAKDTASSFGITGGVAYSTSTGSWGTAGPGGAYTFILSSAVPTAPGTCSVVEPDACFTIHGSVHAVLVPSSSPPGAGTITADVTF